MIALRVHVWMQRKWQLDDLCTSRQEGKHQPALIHNTQLMILDARSTTAGYTDFCYTSISGWQSTLIKSKVIKGILIQSLPNCCHFLAAACGQTVHILCDIIRMECGWKERGGCSASCLLIRPIKRDESWSTPWWHATGTTQQQADNQAFSLISSSRQ